jgi:membrane associated rhomboid family serine protease
MIVEWIANYITKVCERLQPGEGVAWWAHIGGFTAGIILVPFLRK